MEKKERLSNFELLRIISIVIIIFSHFNMHMDYSGVETNIKINKLFSNCFVFGGIANHIFIIITGYFMINSKIKYSKIISLILQMMFYSFCIPIVLNIFGLINLGSWDIIKMSFPMLFGNWFCIYYVILYFLIPFINKLLNEMNKKEMKNMLIILAIFISIIPMLTVNKWGLSSLAIFILDYIIGAYIKLYKKENNTKKFFVIIVIDMIIMIGSVLILQLIGLKLGNNTIRDNSRYFVVSNNSIFVIIMAISIFMVFKNLNIKNCKVINYISSSTLGVYLIHENSYLRNFLWNIFIPNKCYYNSYVYILFAISKVFIIYFLCIIIDKIRNKLFKNIEKKIILKVSNFKNVKFFNKYNNTNF